MPKATIDLPDYSSLKTVSVPLSVYNYYNMPVGSTYTGELGRVYAIPSFSSLSDSLSFIENWGYIIDYGDGTTTNDPSYTHTYTHPGTYNVAVIVIDYNRTYYFSSATFPLVVKDAVPDRISIDSLSGNTGFSTGLDLPLQIRRYNSYQTYPVLSAIGYNITLSVSGNRSKFISESEYFSSKTSHLTSFATFTSSDLLPLTIQTTIQTTNDILYGQLNPGDGTLSVSPLSTGLFLGYPSFMVGTSGQAIVYYYEDV